MAGFSTLGPIEGEIISTYTVEIHNKAEWDMFFEGLRREIGEKKGKIARIYCHSSISNNGIANIHIKILFLNGKIEEYRIRAYLYAEPNVDFDRELDWIFRWLAEIEQKRRLETKYGISEANMSIISDMTFEGIIVRVGGREYFSLMYEYAENQWRDGKGTIWISRTYNYLLEPNLQERLPYIY